MKTLKLFTLILGIAVLYTACSKNGTNGTNGANGATGPQGPQGATGPTGANGTNGTNGTNGNANVKDSVFTVTTSMWSSVSAYDYVSISDPQITAAIVSSGECNVFWSLDGGTAWDNLNWVSENPPGETMSYNWGAGSVTFYFTDNGTAANPCTVFSANCTFKVVCTTADGLKNHPNTNWQNYSQVKAILNAQQ